MLSKLSFKIAVVILLFEFSCQAFLPFHIALTRYDDASVYNHPFYIITHILLEDQEETEPEEDWFRPRPATLLDLIVHSLHLISRHQARFTTLMVQYGTKTLFSVVFLCILLI